MQKNLRIMEIERKNRIRYTHVANWNVYLLFESRECRFSKKLWLCRNFWKGSIYERSKGNIRKFDQGKYDTVRQIGDNNND